MTDDFYIGWQPKAAPRIGRPTRRVDAADDFLVRWMSLEFEPRFVQRLQQLVGALKEEGTQFGVAIFWRLAQEFASTR